MMKDSPSSYSGSGTGSGNRWLFVRKGKASKQVDKPRDAGGKQDLDASLTSADEIPLDPVQSQDDQVQVPREVGRHLSRLNQLGRRPRVIVPISPPPESNRVDSSDSVSMTPRNEDEEAMPSWALANRKKDNKQIPEPFNPTFEFGVPEKREEPPSEPSSSSLTDSMASLSSQISQKNPSKPSMFDWGYVVQNASDSDPSPSSSAAQTSQEASSSSADAGFDFKTPPSAFLEDSITAKNWVVLAEDVDGKQRLMRPILSGDNDTDHSQWEVFSAEANKWEKMDLPRIASTSDTPFAQSPSPKPGGGLFPPEVPPPALPPAPSLFVPPPRPFNLSTFGSAPQTPTPHELKCPRKGAWVKSDKYLGRGSFGSVYKCLNTETGEFFVAKQVPRQEAMHVEQLLQEIETLKKLKRHPNIVQYLGTETDEENVYIFLEFMENGSIQKILEEFKKPFKEEIIRTYTRQLLTGLAYLHEKDLLHRDIKGANILLDKNGKVKLADFGLSKLCDNNMTFGQGTVWWMAPELIKGSPVSSDDEADVPARPRVPHGYGPEVDIWSVGCTVIEMASGLPPWFDWTTKRPKWVRSSSGSHMANWGNEVQAQALFKIGQSKEPPPIPPHLSSLARSFILRCCSLDPSRRPSARDLLEDPFIQEAPSGVQSPLNFGTHMDAHDAPFMSPSSSVTGSSAARPPPAVPSVPLVPTVPAPDILTQALQKLSESQRGVVKRVPESAPHGPLVPHGPGSEGATEQGVPGDHEGLGLGSRGISSMRDSWSLASRSLAGSVRGNVRGPSTRAGDQLQKASGGARNRGGLSSQDLLRLQDSLHKLALVSESRGTVVGTGDLSGLGSVRVKGPDRADGRLPRYHSVGGEDAVLLSHFGSNGGIIGLGSSSSTRENKGERRREDGDRLKDFRSSYDLL